MSYQALLVVLALPMILALGYGVWAGLGYPGLYDRYEPVGRTRRRTPFEMFMDWLVERLGG